MSVFWGSKVTKLAYVQLDERHFNNDQILPYLKDLEKLNDSLKNSIIHLELNKVNKYNYLEVSELLCATFLMYNRRRSGEIEAIR